jgi:FkbM family methyltransferase
MSVGLRAYRRMRVIWRLLTAVEPYVRSVVDVDLEYHGGEDCGWRIQRGVLGANSVVVDIGLGEDVSFSQSLIAKFGLTVHGFDPTPRAIAYIKRLAVPNFVLHEFGIGTRSGTAKFFLPKDQRHVSGSLVAAAHLGSCEIEVSLLTIGEIFSRLGCDRIDLLKLDVEGAEFELFASTEFALYAPRIRMLCVEFHHRWNTFGKQATLDAVRTRGRLGLHCAWRSTTSNEEFLFVRDDR